MATWVIDHYCNSLPGTMLTRATIANSSTSACQCRSSPPSGFLSGLRTGGDAPIKETRSSDFGEYGDCTDTTEVILSD